MSAYTIRPSAAHQWEQCYGSIMMQQRYPEEEGEEAKEGTAAHHVWAHFLTTGQWLVEGSLAPNGVTITVDMLLHGEHYTGVVREHGLPLHVEESIGVGAIHEKSGGTPDTWCVDHGKRILYIYDYKYGHRFVEVYRNGQLVCYAAEIIKSLGGGDWTVIFKIVQPRCFQTNEVVREWVTTSKDLQPIISNLRNAASYSQIADPPTKAGLHCEHCSARHACATLQNAVEHVMSVIGRSVPFDLSPTAVGHDLKRLKQGAKLLDARITGLEQQAIALIRKGSKVPNYAMEQPVGKLTWLDGVDKEVIGLGNLYGINLAKPIQAKTPTQAIAAGIDPGVINAYALRPLGEFKLVPVDTSQTRKLFG